MERMLDLAKVAVTGGISCGKSSVCRAFKKLGAYTISADEIVHGLLSPETDLGKEIIELIGEDILVNGLIDRSRIAKKVFQKSELLQQLENLLFPAVWKTIEKAYESVRQTHSAPLFMAEVPLLFEAGGEIYFNKTICVVADEEICKKRFAQSSGMDEKEYERRMARQLPVAEKARRSDFVIYNDGDMENTEKQVNEIFKRLTAF